MALSSRQNEIIDAAIELIARKGIQDLTIKNLAGEIGVTEGALYRHFPNKNEIVRGMICRFDNVFSEITVNTHGFAMIRQFVTLRMEQILANPSLSKVLFSEEFFASDPEFSSLIQEHAQRHNAWFIENLQEEVKCGTIRSDIPLDVLLKLLAGPIRLLFKQWGLNGMIFDLRKEVGRLLDAMELLFVKEGKR